MSYRDLLVDVKNKAGVITLNRPEKRNALSSELMSELLASLRKMGENDQVHVLVIQGAGPAFCSGHDMAELVDRDVTSYPFKERRGMFFLFISVV